MIATQKKWSHLLLNKLDECNTEGFIDDWQESKKLNFKIWQQMMKDDSQMICAWRKRDRLIFGDSNKMSAHWDIAEEDKPSTENDVPSVDNPDITAHTLVWWLGFCRSTSDFRACERVMLYFCSIYDEW